MKVGSALMILVGSADLRPKFKQGIRAPDDNVRLILVVSGVSALFFPMSFRYGMLMPDEERLAWGIYFVFFVPRGHICFAI